MNGTQAAPGPDAGGHDGVPGEAEHVVTAMLRSDAMILTFARQAVEDGDGSPAGYIAARRGLDREVRGLLPWPSGEDYARAAADYERMGRTDDAALLRRIAATDTLIAAARAEWNSRYDARPSSARRGDDRRDAPGGDHRLRPGRPLPGRRRRRIRARRPHDRR